MRLFTAINFDEDIRQRISDIQEQLRQNCLRGNFSQSENLHITLVFIGEVPESSLSIIKQAVAAVHFESFTLRLNGFGSFGRGNSEILWIGVEKNESLWKLRADLRNELLRNGVLSGSNSKIPPYSPHLTLAREAVMRDSFNRADFSEKTPKIDFPVKKISLMKSERIAGRLVYTEIYAAYL